MELDRDLLAGRFLDGTDDQEVEQRLRIDPELSVAASRLVDRCERGRGRGAIDRLDLQPGPIRNDRLHADITGAAQVRQ